MTRRRWIADEVSGGRAALTGAHAEHLIRVLRVRVGLRAVLALDVDAFEGALDRCVQHVRDAQPRLGLELHLP